MLKFDLSALKAKLENDHPDVLGHTGQLIARVKQFSGEGDRIGDIPAAFWEGLDIVDLNMVLVPPACGGHPALASVLRRSLVSEELGYGDPGLTIALPGPGLSMPPIMALATEAQKRRLFSRFVTDRPCWGAFAITEPGVGSDATAIHTTARDDGDSYVLNGEKCFITNGARADFVVVFATTDKSRGRFAHRAFVVDKGTPGFTVVRTEKMLGVRVSQLTMLSFQDCRVPKDCMLGYEDGQNPRRDAFTGAQGAWDFMRPILSSVIVGTSRALVDHFEQYVEGQEMGARFPLNRAGVSALLDDMRRRIHAGRLLYRHAAWKYDSGLFMSKDASMAKSYVAKTAMDIGQTIMTLVGEEAIYKNNFFEKWYRDIKVFDILEGTGDMQRLMISKIHQSTSRNLGKLVTAVSAARAQQ